MCLFLYSREHRLQIEYVSEYITLSKSGRSDVVIDLLVTNKSKKSINEITVIYPNVFFHVHVLGQYGPFVLDEVGDFEDITNTFLDDDSEFNWTYKGPGCEILRKPNEHTAIEIPSWSNYVGISLPHPNDLTKDIKYEGIVGGNTTPKAKEGLNEACWGILEAINFTIFSWEIEQPLNQDIPRWFRWKFRGVSSVFNRPSPLKKWLSLMINKLHFEYQIFGPYDVRDRFINYLLSYKKMCEYRKKSRDLINAVKSLIYILEQDGLTNKEINTEVIIPSWFVHVNPNNLDRLISPNEDGAVAIAGMQPNYIFTDEQFYKIYEWKAGRFVTSQETGEYKFSILFQTKPTSLIYLLLPWISFFIALISIMLVLK